jgi:hypothetical protein
MTPIYGCSTRADVLCASRRSAGRTKSFGVGRRLTAKSSRPIDMPASWAILCVAIERVTSSGSGSGTNAQLVVASEVGVVPRNAHQPPDWRVAKSVQLHFYTFLTKPLDLAGRFKGASS